jgi:biotin carboxylase
MTARLAVAFAEGSASARELLSLAAERDISITCIPGAGYEDRSARRVLEAVGEVLDGPRAELPRALAERKVGGVVTFADTELIRVAELCAELGLPGLPVEAAHTVRSKYRQRVVLNAASASDLDVVRVHPPALPSEATTLRYPAVLKPEFGVASRDTFPVEGVEAAARAVGDLPDEPFVLESLISTEERVRDGWLGDFVSVESVVVDGDVRHFGVTDKLPLEPPFREGGDIAPSMLPPERQREVTGLAERAIGALGIRYAVLHTEIKLAKDLAVVEVNARLGGYVDALYRRIGVGSPLAAAADVALGAPPGEPASPSRVAVMRAVLPPADATRVVALPDPHELMQAPGVWRVDRLSRPGDPVAWQHGTTGRVLDVFLEAPDHGEARRRLELLEELLASTLRFETQPRG